MDEDLVETDVPTVGERLRAAREAKGLTLEDVAAQTRIPQRHLESLEQSAWDRLPAPTYTTGFAKSYASAVGLDRVEIGEQLRSELGGTRPAMATTEVFEPADPARTMPKSLVFGAIGAVILLVLLMTWLSNRSLDQGDETNNAAVAATTEAPPAPTAPAPAPAAGEPVVLTAIAPVWFQVSEKGGATLFSGMLQPGQSFPVPQTATAPVLKTGKPEALKISVGNAVAPPVGPPATTVSNVSLLPADLMKAGAAPATEPSPPATAPAPARAAPQHKLPAKPRRSAAPGPSSPPAPAPSPAPATPVTNSGE